MLTSGGSGGNYYSYPGAFPFPTSSTTTWKTRRSVPTTTTWKQPHATDTSRTRQRMQVPLPVKAAASPTVNQWGGAIGTTQNAVGMEAPVYPTMPGNGQYDEIMKQMQVLYDRYGDLSFNYRPSTFDYGNFNPETERYAREARERMGFETAARNPVWNEQENAVLRNYQAAIDAATQEQKLQQAAIAQSADTEAGRLANMMANTGMGAGQGAIQEKFGVDRAFADQSNSVASQYGIQRAQAALQKANELGGIGAERAGYLGGLEGQVRDIADQTAANEYNKWLNERGFQYQNFSDSESRNYQAYSDMYTSLQNQLNNQMGVLQNMAGLSQDQRDYLASWLMNEYNAKWEAYKDNRNWTGMSAADQASLDLATRTLGFNQTSSEQDFALQKEALAKLGAGSVWNR